MGLKAGLHLLQQAGKVVANYADDAARLAAQSGDDIARTVATRADDDIPVFLAEHSFILVLNDGRADRGFLNVGKTELFERSAHRFDSDSLVIGNKRRSKADNDGISALNQNLYLFGAVHDLLRILRTSNKTTAAQNTFVTDDVRLVT